MPRGGTSKQSRSPKPITQEDLDRHKRSAAMDDADDPRNKGLDKAPMKKKKYSKGGSVHGCGMARRRRRS